MRDLTRLEVLRHTRRLIADVYRHTSSFPRSEQYGLSSQIRRSAVSIAANIAEGFGRGTEGELERFLRIAAGSAAELDTLLVVAADLDLAGAGLEELRRDTAVVRKMLNRLTSTVHHARTSH